MRILCLIILFFAVNFFPQDIKLRKAKINSVLSGSFSNKIFSGMYYKRIEEKLLSSNKALEGNNLKIISILYFSDYPSEIQKQELKDKGVVLYESSWTPPMINHPFGYFLAVVPISSIESVLSKSFVNKIDDGEMLSYPLNNQAAKSIKADSTWARGWTGTGVKVAILDSGLDSSSSNIDLPISYSKKDYSNYPTSIDTIVANTVTGHGTHVTGSVLGRGILSSANTGNGGGSYKGMSYNAELVFLKIGGDATGSATNAAEIAAMHAAVDTFNAKVLSMSYGGWQTYHDGSSSIEQAIDWVVSKGVPCFLAAGNDGESSRHYSGTVGAADSTAFIQINVAGAGTNNTALIFNLVWRDGIGTHNNLYLKYYDYNHALITDTTLYTTSESTRGTESQYSQYNQYLPSGSGTYYLRVINPSASTQSFHLYETWGNGCVKFNSPDKNYTVAQPASADSGFAVGAFTSRSSWTVYNGSSYSYGQTQDDICSFSSCGPRIDNLQKPNIAAPGSVITSIRDRVIALTPNETFVDNDGDNTGAADYVVGQGTSMAAPICAGAAALILNRYPGVSVSKIYAAIQGAAESDGYTGTVPNSIYGYGKLNVNRAIDESALPVELTTFSALQHKSYIKLLWKTATEKNNYGFNIEVKSKDSEWRLLGFIRGNGNSYAPKNYSYEDYNIYNNSEIFYRLKQIDNDGSYIYSEVISVSQLPKSFSISESYPNPANNETELLISVIQDALFSLKIFNVLGKEVYRINDILFSTGTNHFKINLNSLASGVYYYKIESKNISAIKKLIIMK